MIVEQYGLKYTRVTEQDLETLRYWRNQSYIRNTMQFKEYISPLMQKVWFQKINNKNNYYFIIEHEQKKIGLINCKDSSESKVAEGGIFIWDTSYWGSSTPAYASLTMLQAVFDVFKSGDSSIATVAINNEKAIDFNLMLGYKITGKTPDETCYKLYLTKEDYNLKTKKLIKAAALLYGGNSEFKLTAEINEKQTEEINNYLKQINAK
jgi:UDP-4-amino-4,6-dideoxy-N-acetyl-beta-L-altrosamine N-acetyltransferase